MPLSFTCLPQAAESTGCPRGSARIRALRGGAHDVATGRLRGMASATSALRRARSASSSMRAETPMPSPRGM
jgi:hypothetical protein